MDCGYFIAQKGPDGSPGKPIGNDDGAIMVFEELDVCVATKERLSEEIPSLAVYRINVSFSGEVVE